MRRGGVLHHLALLLALLALAVFLVILLSLLREGLPSLTWHFLVNGPHMRAGGIGPEILNTGLMVGITLAVTAPLGLIVAVFQREYGRRSTQEIDRLRATLLSAPTIVAALVVYRVAVGWWHWPVSILTGCLALSVINWPFMVTVANQALGSVPDSYREASWALGATRFETVMRVVLPASLKAFIDGVGLAAARLAGESAALIVTAGVNISQHWSLWGPGETLAVHIWYIRTEGIGVSRDAEAAATGVTLMVFISVVLWISGRLARLFGGAPTHEE